MSVLTGDTLHADHHSLRHSAEQPMMHAFELGLVLRSAMYIARENHERVVSWSDSDWEAVVTEHIMQCDQQSTWARHVRHDTAR